MRLAALAAALIALWVLLVWHLCQPPHTSSAPAVPVGEAARPMQARPESPSLVSGRVHAASRSRTPMRAGRRLPPILLRIRHCESHDDYRAENPHSTASGAWQVVDGTWNHFRGYRHAADAPRWVQDAQALALYLDRGTAPWNASRGCWA